MPLLRTFGGAPQARTACKGGRGETETARVPATPFSGKSPRCLRCPRRVYRSRRAPPRGGDRGGNPGCTRGPGGCSPRCRRRWCTRAGRPLRGAGWCGGRGVHFLGPVGGDPGVTGHESGPSHDAGPRMDKGQDVLTRPELLRPGPPQALLTDRLEIVRPRRFKGPATLQASGSVRRGVASARKALPRGSSGPRCSTTAFTS